MVSLAYGIRKERKRRKTWSEEGTGGGGEVERSKRV